MAIFRGLAYTDSDTGSVPVLLTHGAAFDGTVFAPQIDALLEAGHRVLTVDAPGHGLSTRAPESWTHAEFADDIAALLADRGIEQAVVVGHSQGGWAGLHLALRHPDRVRGLVLIGSSAHAFPEEAKAPLRQSVTAWAAGTPQPGYLDEQTHNNFGRADGPAARWRERWATEDPKRYVAGYDALADRPDLRPQLSGVTAPTLVIAGEHDPWITADEAKETAALIPGAGFALIPGAWHTFTETHADEVTGLLLDFVGG